MGIRERLGTAAAVVGTVFVALTVAGWLGGLWWVFDLASNFRVQYAVVLVPIVGLLLVAKRWVIAAVAALAVAANAMMIVPLYTSQPAPAADQETLKVMSANVYLENRHPDRVVDAIRASGADIVFLYETSPRMERAVSTADLPYRAVSAGGERSRFGMMALIPQGAELQELRLADPQDVSMVVTLSFDARSLEVLGVHPPSPLTPERASARDDELRAVGAWAAQQELPVVVAGDLNASTWSHGFSLVSRHLINSQLGYGVEASWPVGLAVFGIPIDHLLHSSELTVVDRQLGEPLGSDHYPLYVTLAWAAGQ